MIKKNILRYLIPIFLFICLLNACHRTTVIENRRLEKYQKLLPLNLTQQPSAYASNWGSNKESELITLAKKNDPRGVWIEEKEGNDRYLITIFPPKEVDEWNLFHSEEQIKDELLLNYAIYIQLKKIPDVEVRLLGFDKRSFSEMKVTNTHSDTTTISYKPYNFVGNYPYPFSTHVTIQTEGHSMTLTVIKDTLSSTHRLVRVSTIPTLDKLQSVSSPHPYESREVAFRNYNDSTTLYGTLTIPHGGKKNPTILLVCGTGRNTRDYGGIFSLLSDYFTKKGFAVLRYDKRGAGKSVFKNDTIDLNRLTDDAESAIRFLRNQPEVDSSRLGIIGHSQGATIAQKVSLKQKVSYVISMFGIGATSKEICATQKETLAIISGVNPKKAKLQHKFSYLIDSIHTAVTPEDSIRLRKAAIVICQQLLEYKPTQFCSLIVDQLLFSYKLFCGIGNSRLDPKDIITQMSVPFFALSGDQDALVDCETNIELIRQYIKESKIKESKIKIYPGINHNMQPLARKYNPMYFETPIICDPQIMEDMYKWIRKVQ